MPGIVAYIPEFPELFPALSVWEHFLFMATVDNIIAFPELVTDRHNRGGIDILSA